jgi:hypothetical protein
MGARVYNPYTGTFTQPDPIQGGGANAYGYTDGDPVNETDLTGDAACGWAEPWGCAIDAGEDIVDDAGGAALDLGSKVFGGVAGAILGPLIFPSNVGAASCEMNNDCGAVFAKGSPSQRLPKTGTPNSTGVLDRGNGSGQIRDYGANGEAQTDFDFGHDHGAGDPHAHDWTDGVRGEGRVIRPGE